MNEMTGFFFFYFLPKVKFPAFKKGEFRSLETLSMRRRNKKYKGSSVQLSDIIYMWNENNNRETQTRNNKQEIWQLSCFMDKQMQPFIRIESGVTWINIFENTGFPNKPQSKQQELRFLFFTLYNIRHGVKNTTI